jgi:hypothetical protein
MAKLLYVTLVMSTLAFYVKAWAVWRTYSKAFPRIISCIQKDLRICDLGRGFVTCKLYLDAISLHRWMWEGVKVKIQSYRRNNIHFSNHTLLWILCVLRYLLCCNQICPRTNTFMVCWYAYFRSRWFLWPYGMPVLWVWSRFIAFPRFFFVFLVNPTNNIPLRGNCIARDTFPLSRAQDGDAMCVRTVAHWGGNLLILFVALLWYVSIKGVSLTYFTEGLVICLLFVNIRPQSYLLICGLGCKLFCISACNRDID